jgi:hypothetical protein
VRECRNTACMIRDTVTAGTQAKKKSKKKTTTNEPQHKSCVAYLVVFLPHISNQGLPRKYGVGETNLDRLDSRVGDVCVSVCVCVK